jgi:hypothetical protein
MVDGAEAGPLTVFLGCRFVRCVIRCPFWGRIAIHTPRAHAKVGRDVPASLSPAVSLVRLSAPTDPATVSVSLIPIS